MTHAAATFSAALAEGAQRLRGRSPTPRLDAEVLLMHATGWDRAALLARPGAPLPAAARARLDALLARRQAGEPVAYLVGRREFWSLSLRVTPAVLVPRPETEVLVEAALARLPADRDLAAADLGTGSGCVALALAVERPRARIVATDVETAALAVARDNARRLGIRNVAFRAGHWHRAVAGERFHAVVSNPPYVPDGDPRLAGDGLRHEPRRALAAGPEGLDALEEIAAGAPARLHPGGWLLVEHGWDQEDRVQELFRQAGFTAIETLRDLAGRPRVTAGRRAAC